MQAPCIPLLELRHKHHRCFRLRDPDRQRFAAAVLNSTTFFVRPAAQRSNGAPTSCASNSRQELWEQAGWLTMDMTRGDIDECASAYVMIDKDGNPTGASPPDPDRAYCMVCWRRIWAYDDNTAFPTELGLDGDWIDVGGGACCREMFAIKRRQTVGEAGQVASINLFHYRRGVWPTSRVFIACGPVASCIPPGCVYTNVWYHRR